MKKVNLNLSGRSIPNKIAFAGTVVLQMSGNAYFPTPSPTLTAVKTAADALNLAYQKAQTGGNPAPIPRRENPTWLVAACAVHAAGSPPARGSRRVSCILLEVNYARSRHLRRKTGDACWQNALATSSKNLRKLWAAGAIFGL